LEAPVITATLFANLFMSVLICYFGLIVPQR
jgi:hypothetical protein